MKQGATLLFEKKNPRKIQKKSSMHQHARVRRDSRWSAMRNIIVSIYQPSHLAGLIPTMESCIERAATNLAEGKEIAFSELALSLATDVIGQAAFGADFGLCREPASRLQEGDGGSAAKAASEFINMHIYSTTSLKMDMSGSLSVIVGTLVPFLLKPLRQLLLRVPGSADRETTRVNDELRRMMDGVVNGRAAARGDLASASSQKQTSSPWCSRRGTGTSPRENCSRRTT
jgi:carlactone C-19 oxidase